MVVNIVHVDHEIGGCRTGRRSFIGRDHGQVIFRYFLAVESTVHADDVERCSGLQSEVAQFVARTNFYARLAVRSLVVVDHRDRGHDRIFDGVLVDGRVARCDREIAELYFRIVIVRVQ